MLIKPIGVQRAVHWKDPPDKTNIEKKNIWNLIIAWRLWDRLMWVSHLNVDIKAIAVVSLWTILNLSDIMQSLWSSHPYFGKIFQVGGGRFLRLRIKLSSKLVHLLINRDLVSYYRKKPNHDNFIIWRNFPYFYFFNSDSLEKIFFSLLIRFFLIRSKCMYEYFNFKLFSRAYLNRNITW